ncbi:MAG: hypothetical protein ACLGHL_10235 [Actinomycetota bacterium]
MEAFGIWLAAVGITDLIAAPSGEPQRGGRAYLGVAVGTSSATLFAIVVGSEPFATLVLTIVTAVSTASWLWGRAVGRMTSRRAVLLASAAGGALFIVAASAAWWPSPDGGHLARFLDRSPFDILQGRSPASVLTVVGCLTFLGGTSNALVRLLLVVTGTPVAIQQRLRGGRFIGPMERILIFGFGLTGNLTAAAVVATAKGLLRFPEISSEGQGDIHSATEYFLVGSLASWMLALGLLALV